MKSSVEDLIIQSENEGRVFTILIFEDHFKHIMRHLPYIWKPVIFKHCLHHLILWRKKDRQRLPTVEVDDVLNANRRK